MIRKHSEQTIVQVENPQNGQGQLEIHRILNSEAELDGKGNAFNHCFLAPGSSLGYHRHVGTSETVYVLSGQGDYTDENGEHTLIGPGDVTFTDDGQSHGILALGPEPLEVITLVLYKKI